MADFTMNSIGALLSGGGVKAISKRTRLPAGDVAKVIAMMEPSDTYFEAMAKAKNTTAQRIAIRMSSAIRTPTVLAMPLPPLNPI